MAVNQNIQVSTQRQKKPWSWSQCQCLGPAARTAGAQPGDTRGCTLPDTSAPASSDGPSQVRGASMKTGWRAEKAAGKEEKRTKGVTNCTGNTKVREEEEKWKEKEKAVQGGAVIHMADTPEGTAACGGDLGHSRHKAWGGRSRTQELLLCCLGWEDSEVMYSLEKGVRRYYFNTCSFLPTAWTSKYLPWPALD